MGEIKLLSNQSDHILFKWNGSFSCIIVVLNTTMYVISIVLLYNSCTQYNYVRYINCSGTLEFTKTIKTSYVARIIMLNCIYQERTRFSFAVKAVLRTTIKLILILRSFVQQMQPISTS